MSLGGIALRVQAIEAGLAQVAGLQAAAAQTPGSQAVAVASASPAGEDFTAALTRALAAGRTAATVQAPIVQAGPVQAGPAQAAAPGTHVTAEPGMLADNGATGADVVADARRYLGVPYVFGGTTRAGLDCSGLVQKVFGDLGVAVPRLVTGQMTEGVRVPSLAQARPGDLIVADGGNHIAIYAGDGNIIEAPHPGLQVRERSNWITPANTVTIRRIVPDAPTGVGGVPR